ncbi:hypothetical protein OXX59_005744 [Metschnikowia pulcherrima]
MNIVLVLHTLVAYTAAVYVGWPMNEQLPNVARAEEAYSFTLADSTYKSSAGGQITYSATNLPSWLSFDSASRTFSGTPSEEDVTTFEVALTGTDSADNSNYTATYSMLVSNSSGLALSSSDVMFTEIAQYGNTNGADGLVVSQGETFSIEFSQSVFKQNTGATRPIVAYYGRSGDRTSLPNWVDFDADSLTFSGQVPNVVSSIAPSIEYTFAFIASDYAGYAGAEGTFKLVVGAHQLSTSLNESIKINGTYGSEFSYTVPVLTDVYLDNALIQQANISSVTTQNMPDYVSFDSSSYSLSGTFPNASSFQNFTVVVQDSYGDTVSLPYSFDSLDSVFTVDSLRDVNATRGEYFSHELLRSYFTDYSDTDVEVSFSNASWLAYHSSNMTMNGETPSDFASAEVTVKASSGFGSDTRSFRVLGVEGVHTSSSSSSRSSSSASKTSSASAGVTATASSTATATATSSSSSPPIGKSNGNHRKLVLGLAIGLPLLALLLALIILIFCCCRRKKTTDEDNEADAGSDTEITGPGFGRIDSNDDHAETARQLGALNALKLDDDTRSVSSSVTHVDSDSEFHDAQEKPMVSWRANEASDSSAMKKMLLREKHASEASLSTVNTEQLFSVRLVDESVSNRSSAFRKSGDLAGVMRDVSAGNIQRLDSDGNVVGSSATSSPTKAKSGTQTSLNNISEEDSNNTFYTQESSDYNLLAKFLGSQTGSQNSSLSAENVNKDIAPVPDNSERWHASVNGTLLPSPDAETFLLDNDASHSPKKFSVERAEAGLSRTSVYSDLSFGEAGDDARGSKVKLVEFTRKASLRDSSRQQYIDHPANQAQILDDSD